MFEKRLSELTADDIREVVKRRVAEGVELELKQALDGNPGSDNARDDLVKEVLAFANAYGGTLLVGISENADRRAVGILPVQDCKDVADRLARAVPDVIEPRIPGFECEGVVTEGNGRDGVLVLRVPASILGPHRHTIKAKSSSGQVYVRRNTESVAASMREIHDLVLSRARGGDRLLDLCAKAYGRFDAERARIPRLGSNTFSTTDASFVAVAVPIPRLQVPDLIGRMPAEPQVLTLPLKANTGTQAELAIPVHSRSAWSPRLRGIRTVCVDQSMAAALDAGEDGSVTTGFWYSPPDARLRDGTPCIYLAWLLATVASVLVRLDKARRRASHPDAQYVLTARLVLRGDWLMDLSGSDDGAGRVAVGHLEHVEFPDHLVGEPSGFHDVMLGLERDLVNASGNSFVSGREVDFDAVLRG